ncbi:hypothetical protein ACG2F4_12240 [Halalkalibaculum sp. DA3122]|uniref:hypothetical protein n=1 Tax=unclassified Halalkalibaculum TaxID=2964617 RepID=UPI00375403F6
MIVKLFLPLILSGQIYEELTGYAMPGRHLPMATGNSSHYYADMLPTIKGANVSPGNVFRIMANKMAGTQREVHKRLLPG